MNYLTQRILFQIYVAVVLVVIPISSYWTYGKYIETKVRIEKQYSNFSQNFRTEGVQGWLHSDIENLKKETWMTVGQNFLLILLSTALFGFLLFWNLRRQIIGPLEELARIFTMAHEDPTLRMNTSTRRSVEINRIAENFNLMMTLINDQQKQIIYSSKMSALGQMAAGIAHEINNPLSIIMGYAFVVKERLNKKNWNAQEVQQQLSRIHETTEKIARIIRGLNSFSKNPSLDEKSYVPMKCIIERTMDLCVQRFRNHGIQLQVEEAPDVLLKCHEQQIVQVLLNLLNNAYDAVIGHEAPRWVQVSFELEARTLRIFITDCGVGISRLLSERIMEPFFTTKEVGKGTGLGLSIAKGIVEEHEGRLELNRECQNTQFVVEFPGTSFMIQSQISTQFETLT